MKAIRWLLKLVLTMITLPLILAVWLIKWFVVFLHHCSAWTFYLLGSVVLATAVLSFLMQQSQGIEALQMLIGGFVIFMIPQVVGGVVLKPQGGNYAVLPLEKSCPRLDIGRLTLFMG